MLDSSFFDQPALSLAPALLGKVIRRKIQWQGKPVWLSARIIETEAYELDEKGSHASLGYTEKRKALFMDGGTIYMYYARGGDSLNFSARGPGNAVLIKSGHYHIDRKSPAPTLDIMHQLNPANSGERPAHKLCSGQTLLCKSLSLKVPDWDAKTFKRSELYVEDINDSPDEVIQCRRLGIPQGRDEHLMYRFVDPRFAKSCTKNPLTSRGVVEGVDYLRVKNRA